MGSAPPEDLLRPLRWEGDALLLLDQTLLPASEVWLRIEDVDTLCEAIRSLRVRGAPAIGIAAAYGMVLAARSAIRAGADGAEALDRIRESRAALAATRPTAVNLFWALQEMDHVLEDPTGPVDAALLDRALAIHEDDIARGRAMGAHGAALLPADAAVLTHCNAGALATGGYGTALGVVRAAAASAGISRVYHTETRPLFQGARLTGWELDRMGIPHTLIVDSAAAQVMREGRVHAVVVGADRIAANGDVANKVGTLALALAARAFEVPFYVAAPFSTVDPDTPDGAGIPIEERGAEEVLRPHGAEETAPEGTIVYAPAFDITRADLVTAIITERGVVSRVDTTGMRALMMPDR